MKNYYCTLDTETFGGASKPKGIYHLGGLVHDRQGNILACFNYLIAEHYEEIEKDSYAKKNFDRYVEMVKNGVVTVVPTEAMAVACVNSLLHHYSVNYVMAFNSGFDLTKTRCSELVKNRQYIDIYLMAVETLACRKKFSTFCHEHNLCTASRKSVSTSAQTFYAYLTNNPSYAEEHTALEDAKIELEIFLACVRAHKPFTKNIHFYDAKPWDKVPRW